MAAKTVNVQSLVSELEDIATILQNKNLFRVAAKLDIVSNTLEDVFKRTASDPDKAPEGAPPGSQSTVQVADQFDASRGRDYGPTPIGNDSVGEALGMSSVADILNRLDFAQHKEADDLQDVHIQAGKKATKKSTKKASAEWPFSDLTPAQFARFASQGQWDQIKRAADMVLANRKADSSLDANDDGMDEGDEDDLYSTGGLPAAGSEDLIGDSDIGPDQKGILPVYDKTPAGTGEGPGHFGPSASRKALAILRAAAGARKADEQVKPDTFSPDDHFGEGKKPIEESHSLGGKGKGAEASQKVAGVTVVRPKFVPPYLSAVWNGAVEHTNKTGRLLKAGKVDYAAITANYKKVLAAFVNASDDEDKKDDDKEDDSEDKKD